MLNHLVWLVFLNFYQCNLTTENFLNYLLLLNNNTVLFSPQVDTATDPNDWWLPWTNTKEVLWKGRQFLVILFILILFSVQCIFSHISSAGVYGKLSVVIVVAMCRWIAECVWFPVQTSYIGHLCLSSHFAHLELMQNKIYCTCLLAGVQHPEENFRGSTSVWQTAPPTAYHCRDVIRRT